MHNLSKSEIAVTGADSLILFLQFLRKVFQILRPRLKHV